MINYKITDQEKFDKANIVDVDTDDLKPIYNGSKMVGFKGTLSIEIEGESIDANRFWGEHEARDYEDKYGFELIEE